MPVAGPFYFYWADAGATFNAGNLVMEEYIFSFNLAQAETEFASLDIEIKNPGVAGLLASGQPLWAFFGYDGGSGNTALFYGRLVAIPTDLLATVITLKFVARPDDYEAQRHLLMMDIHYAGRPFWDPIFIDAAHQEDPDAALEAISQDWHTDRVTLSVSTSDILVGEDGTVTFALGEAFLDELNVTVGEAPIQRIDVDATVPWQQTFGGTIDFGIWNWSGPSTSNVINAWPKTGDQLSGGWSVVVGFAKMTVLQYNHQNVSFNVSYQNEAKTHKDGDTMSLNASYSGPIGGPQGEAVILKYNIVVGNPYYGTPAHTEKEEAGVFTQTNQVSAGGSTQLVLGYGMDRPRTEKITFTVQSDIQAVLKPATDTAAPEKISKSGSTVQAFVTGQTGAASYFMTDRGNWSVEYLIELAVARLKLAARIVKVTWGTTFARAIELTCRKSAMIFDPRLQHGQAVGKITAYSMTGNGDSGEFKGSVTISCAIGLSASLTPTVTPSPGTPTYSELIYVSTDYQAVTGAVVPIGAGNVGYSPPIVVPNDDGLVFPLTKEQVTITNIQHNNEFVPPEAAPPSPQITTIQIGAQTDQTAVGTAQGLLDQRREQLQQMIQATNEAAANYQSWLELELIDISANAFGSAATVTVANLQLPMQYDVTSP